MGGADLLLERLLADAAVTPATRAVLAGSRAKNEASSYLVGLLGAPNVFSSAMAPTTTGDSPGGSLVEEIADLGSRATDLHRKSTAVLVAGWEANLEAHTVLEKAQHRLACLADRVGRVEREASFECETLALASATSVPSAALVHNLDALVPILELASLSHSLLALSKYPECIEISSLVRRLLIRYSDSSLVAAVDRSVALEIDGMVHTLVRLISTNIKQSTLVKVVSLLKRITSGPLQEIFFKSRHHFVLNELDALAPLLEVGLTERYLKRAIEVVREHCFQTIATSESLFDAPPQQSAAFVWAIVDTLGSLVKTHLPDVHDPAAVDSLVLQLAYCAQSLSRRGADFSSKLAHDLAPQLPPARFWDVVRRQRGGPTTPALT